MFGGAVLYFKLGDPSDRRLLHILLAVVAIFFASVSPSQSQSDRPTLTIGWVHSPPLGQVGEDGGKAGFFIEFAQLIADEIDHELIIREYQTAADAVRAQIAGETEMIAGAAAFDIFKASNLFSVPMGRTQSRIFVHADRAIDWGMNTVSGEVISTNSINFTPDVNALLSRNMVVAPQTMGSGLMGVLSATMPRSSIRKKWQATCCMRHALIISLCRLENRYASWTVLWSFIAHVRIFLTQSMLQLNA